MIEESKPIIKIKQAETIYDFLWYPKMNSSNPSSCFFASTCKDQPIKLWDAYTGEKKETYTGKRITLYYFYFIFILFYSLFLFLLFLFYFLFL